MAIDFEALITKHAGDDGNIPAANVSKIVSAISSAVGREFVAKDRYNAKLDEITQLEQDKQTAEDELTKAKKWEDKYTKEHDAFEKYKSDTDAEKQLDKIKAAYKRDVLKPAGIADKYIDDVMNVTSFDGMTLDADGKLEKADDYKKTAETKWASFKATTRTNGADVDNPPKDKDNNGANSRAAELAKQFHERRYGKAPAQDGANNN